MIFELPEHWSTSSTGDESDSEEPLQYDSDDLLHYSSDSDLASLSGLDSESPSLPASYPASPSLHEQADDSDSEDKDDSDSQSVTLFWEESTLDLSSLSISLPVLPVSLASPQEIPTVTQDSDSILRNQHAHDHIQDQDTSKRADNNNDKVDKDEHKDTQEPETLSAVETMEMKDCPDALEKPEPAGSDRTRDQDTKHEPVAGAAAVEAKEEQQQTAVRGGPESVPRTVQLYAADTDTAHESSPTGFTDSSLENQASALTQDSSIHDALVIRVMITGSSLTPVERNQIQDQISKNFWVHHGVASSLNVHYTHLDTPLPAEENDRLKEFDFFVYMLPTTGVLWRDARAVVPLALVAPLVMVSRPEVDPVTLGDLKWELRHKLQVARPIALEDYGKLVQSITSSLISRDDLGSLSLQGIIFRQSTILASRPADNDIVSSALAYLYNRWHQLVELYPYTALSYVLGVALLACLAAFLTEGGQQQFTLQPAHAKVQQMQYAQNGRVGIAQVDFFTPQGSVFKPKHPYPLQVRVLGDPQVGPFRGTKMNELPDVAEPIVQDLMNGTSKVYITSLRRCRRYRNHYQDPKTMLPVHWACVEPTRYYLHMWFENGTQVPDTPLELVWPKNRRATFAAERGSEKTLEEKEIEWDDDDDDLLKGLFSGPLSLALSNETRVWLEAMVPRLRPVFCDVHAAVQSAIVMSMESAKNMFGVVSVCFDYLFGTKDYLPKKIAIVQQKAVNLFRKGEHAAVAKISSLMERLGKKPVPKERKDVAIALEQKFLSVVEYVKVDLRERFSTKHAEPLLEKVDKVLSEFPNQFDPLLDKADKAFSELESRLDDLIRSKRVQEMAENFQKDKILKRADRVLARAECKMGKAMQSKIVQRAQRKVQDKIEHLRGTAEGVAWKRRWESWIGGAQSCSKKSSKRDSCGRHR